MNVDHDQHIEDEIQAKGLNAPRLTPQGIEDKIINEHYHRFKGTTVTVCLLTMENGFSVIGESAAVSMANFDEEIGRKVARQHARDRLWKLEGYLLRQKLHEASTIDAEIEKDVEAESIHRG